jgi:hypothetical protein
MSTIDDVRKFALSQPGVEEVQHFEYRAFRTKRRIFITLREAEQRAAMFIPEEHQEILFEARPEAYEPLHWGKITRCWVNLKKVPKKELEALVKEAAEYSAPLAKRKSKKRR